MEAKPEAKWLEPGVMATVRHLRGEDDLRHASVQEVAK
jgi:bifunctional non-homologous end joining protein LigD